MKNIKLKVFLVVALFSFSNCIFYNIRSGAMTSKGMIVSGATNNPLMQHDLGGSFVANCQSDGSKNLSCSKVSIDKE